MTKKIIITLLNSAALFFVIAVISNSFDYDLGWHLRFGADALAGHFQYLDSYTWGYFGQPWTNHEWGGDLLFWFLYSRCGYFSLALITALSVFAAFFLIQKLFLKKITMAGSLMALAGVWASQHILVPRLAMFAPLFFVLTLYILEKKKFYCLPPLLWLWSALHGSWILGFITINIYLLGNLITIFLKHKNRLTLLETKWIKKDAIKIIIWQIISVLIICLNPYGFTVIKEVSEYFSLSFYKTHITEWVASYTYPVFWKPLILQTISAVFIIVAAKKKQITYPQLLLFIAIFYASWQYKRQAIFAVLLSIPILTATLENAAHQLEFSAPLIGVKQKTALAILCIACLTLLNVNYLLKIRYVSNVWQDKSLLNNTEEPFVAVEFLKQKLNNLPTQKIFNEFSWGAYLNWQLKNHLVFFDGRGAATWKKTENQTMLEFYFELLEQNGGLKYLENNGVNYVILRQPNYDAAKPDCVNRWLFKNKFNQIFKIEKTRLQTDLEDILNWKTIYEDNNARIWERKKVEIPPPT